MPAGELSQRMSYQEFLEHLADYQLEPWDNRRSDLHAAQVVSTLANLHRPKGRKPYSLQECCLHFGSSSTEPPDPHLVAHQIEHFFNRYEQHQERN